MKVIITTAMAAAAAVGLGPTANAAGFVDLGYVSLKPSSGSSLNGVRFGGAADAKLSTNWVAQFDGDWTRFSSSGSDFTISTGAAHATYRSTDWALGGYVSGGDLGGTGIWGLGAEGQYFIDRVSLGGQVGYDTIDNSNGHGWDGNVSGKYFFTDNLSAGAHYGHIDFSGGGPNTTLNVYGLGGEWKADAHPIGVFGSYDRVDASSGGSGHVDVWQVGVRWNFGGDTLLNREHTGASLSRGNVLTRYLF